MSGAGFELEGKVVVITGAAQGIGRVVAHHFARAGAIAIVADRQADKAQAVAAEITADGGQATAVTVDVAEPNSAAAMAETVRAAHGRIDVLINNAGIYTSLDRKPFFDIPIDEWEAVMRVNVTGSFVCAKAVVGAMRAAGWGRIINVSSSTVPLGIPMMTHYVASKAAVIGMTRSMARELGGDGITVNAILPGLTETEVPNPAVDEVRRQVMVAHQAIPRKQVPEDLVGAMLFLASPRSEFMTGQSLVVDGGAALS